MALACLPALSLTRATFMALEAPLREGRTDKACRAPPAGVEVKWPPQQQQQQQAWRRRRSLYYFWAACRSLRRRRRAGHA